jgi:hypothetical protein
MAELENIPFYIRPFIVPITFNNLRSIKSASNEALFIFAVLRDLRWLRERTNRES